MWNISRLNYYADWVTIPFLILAALFTDVLYHGVTLFAILAAAFGYFAWTFVEYALHRWAFHRFYRKEHWIHHIRPGAYFGVPSWQTTAGWIAILGGCWGSLGIDIGGGLFVGLASGYLAYIVVHDRFHHGSIIEGSGTYLSRRLADHRAHHDSGKEVNFGVVTPLWDVLLKTRP